MFSFHFWLYWVWLCFTGFLCSVSCCIKNMRTTSVWESCRENWTWISSIVNSCATELHSGWPPSPPLQGWHFIKRPCDRARVLRSILPLPPLPLCPVSWCAFYLVPNDSCDETVMLCDHTSPQLGLLSASSVSILSLHHRALQVHQSLTFSLYHPWYKVASHQISFHCRSICCKCVYVYEYIAIRCRQKRPSG